MRFALIFLLLTSVLTGRGDAGTSPATSTSIRAALPFVAVLANGFSIPHHHFENKGTLTRLFLSADNDSYVDVPAASIVEIKQQEAAATSSVAAEGDTASEPVSLEVDKAVAAASERQRVDADLIRSVISAESGFHSQAVSAKGAKGLMQLMPVTALDLGLSDPFDARGNVEAGTRYLRELLLQYNGDLIKALAAYNAGPQRVDEYHGVPPFPETRAYVARVIRDFNRKKQQKHALRTAKPRSAAAVTASSKASGALSPPKLSSAELLQGSD